MSSSPADETTCPVLSSGDANRVTLAHGDGGRKSREFLARHIFAEDRFLTREPFQDAAHLTLPTQRAAFCCDSFVVSPLFFPGGDIGQLAVHGTCNDLIVAGARPKWLSLSMILEEGLPLSTLDDILQSVASTAREVGVSIVTGDTKITPKGAVDQLFLNTSGIGELVDPVPAGPASIAVGDSLLVSGLIGRHGAAILCARERIALEPMPVSDVGSLFPVADSLKSTDILVRVMRDATRGGVAAVLHEWADACGLTMLVRDQDLPIGPDVRGTCELLGIDPIFMACERVMVIAVPDKDELLALRALQRVSPEAAVIGKVLPRGPVSVVRQGVMGKCMAVIEPLSACMPRIC